MATFLICLMLILLPFRAAGQTDSIVVPDAQIIDLDLLVGEALMKNPDIKANALAMDVAAAKASGLGAWPAPEFRWMQEAMPDFRFGEAMFSRIELMQTIPFPTKPGLKNTLGQIESEHAHHDHLEKQNEIIAKVKATYYELWNVQQNVVLQRQNLRLLTQFSRIAGRRYAVGSARQQDVLKAQIELSSADLELLDLRRRELTLKSLLSSLVDRPPGDTLGYAVIPEEFTSPADLDTLLHLATTYRPMVLHDSVGVIASRTMLSLAQQEWLPEFRFGIERVITPMTDFRGWSVSLGMSIPFAPWSHASVSAAEEEASAGLEKANVEYHAEMLRVSTAVKESYLKAGTTRRRLTTLRDLILPRAEQSLRASLASYETGQSDALELIDAYRTNVGFTREYFMARLELEQTISELEMEVGINPLPLLR
jgi:cobalt-zinc-cadmium efflux system outer membrane protein